MRWGPSALLILAGCSSSSSTTSTAQGSNGCASGDPSECSCPSGATAYCSSDTPGTSGCACQMPVEAAPPPPPTPFAGNWSPVAGSGEETCTDGESSPLTPNTAAIFPITQDDATTLTVDGAGAAASCSLQLRYSGDRAALATAGQYCIIPGSNGVKVVYTQFDLAFIFTGPAGVDEAGGDEGGEGGEDAASPPDASTGPDGGSPEAGAIDYKYLDWQFSSAYTDAVKTCTTTLHYTLVRD